ncbi:hypothetical protein [Nocardioides sp.]|uniref:hypothetical protein n=1 Tax=Nocardioides sp. TaxID=35761 RepID=UPI003563EAF7
MTVGTPTGAHPLRRYATGLFSLIDSRWTPLVAAAAAVLLRLPALATPLRSDESGFLLVARAWDPQPDSLFGPYFVDRPPLLIAAVRLADWVGGPYFLRVVGAVACGLLVLAAAQVARLIANDLAARWTAVAVAALTVNPLIDAEAVKGELLALPVIMGSFWLTLLAVRSSSARLAVLAAVLAGVLAGVAVGLKQNLVAGLVFAAVVLVMSRLTGRLSGRQLLRLGGAAAVGAAIPVAITVGWALAVGVHLSTLAYTVYGFRSDAALVIAEQSAAAPLGRALTLVLVAIGAGLVFVIGGFLVHLAGEWRDDPVITAATLAVLVVDVAGLVAGGSYWRDYLFPLVPATALCAAMLARRSSRRGRAMRTVIVAAAASSALVVVGWIGLAANEAREAGTEIRGGQAIAEASAPGDTLVVFGGHAEVQLASGLRSPYPHLWSLPMRTLDPEYVELRALLSGPEAPTWLMASVPFDAWDNPAGAALAADVDRFYVRHGTGCFDRPIYLHRGLDRPAVTVAHCR